jgi:glycosyltransferase involved in cell wall biosynthesis
MMVRSLPGAFLAMLNQMRKIQPDLLYTSQQRYDLILARMLARLFHVPHVIHLHYSVGPWLGNDVLHAIRRSHHLIAISQFIRQTALLQGIDASAISTVPNSIGPDAFRQSVDRASMRAEFGWDHDTPVLISAGRLDPMKGHHRLIEVFSQVLARLPQARLLICGRTLNRSDYPDFLRQRVADLGIQHAVVFTGHRYDLPSLMQEADVFSLLSEMEPFGLVFLEAMAVGLPVATYYSGSVPEIIIDGVTGFISDPDQPAVLVNNLVRLLSDRSLAGQMGTAGQKRAADIFSPEVITPRWVDTLRRYALKAPVPLTAR